MRSLLRNPLLLFTIAVFAVLIIPVLFMQGMFMDGLLYASVSRNLAEGNGSLWEQFFSSTIHAHFHEQPPMLFLLEGFFFRIFGDHFYTERFFSLCCAVLNAVLIAKCWKIVTGKRETSWLPILLWVIMPVTFYAFNNNLEEMLMSVFVLAAAIPVLRSVKGNETDPGKWMIAGIWILCAGLTKGVQGMFLLSAPFFAWIVLGSGNWKTFLLRSVAIATPLMFFICFVLVYKPAAESFRSYYVDRILHTFNHSDPQNDSHLHLLKELWLDTMLSLAVVAIMLLAFLKKIPLAVSFRQQKKMILFLAAISFAGIAPLFVTLEQRGFYLVTALPFVALALALLVEEQAISLARSFEPGKIRSRILASVSLLILCGSLVATGILWGKPRRDEARLQFLDKVAAESGEGRTISVCQSVRSDWGIITYGQRFHHLNFTSEIPDSVNFYISLVPDTAKPVEFVKTSISAGDYILFRRDH